jgi:hypothetical protein
VIGDLYFTIKSTANATGEIGWTLHPDFAGHGYMTEAAGANLEIAFASIRLHRVCAELDPRNIVDLSFAGTRTPWWRWQRVRHRAQRAGGRMRMASSARARTRARCSSLS